jgi:hypothetical protein
LRIGASTNKVLNFKKNEIIIACMNLRVLITMANGKSLPKKIISIANGEQIQQHNI